MLSASALHLNSYLIFLLLGSVVVFYVVKSVLKSIVKAFFYSVLAFVSLLLAGLVYAFGFDSTINFLKGLFGL